VIQFPSCEGCDGRFFRGEREVYFLVIQFPS